MRFINKFTISQRIFITFIVILVVIIFFSISISDDINKLGKFTVSIYEHPLNVSNASMRANKNVIKIHRYMKGLILTETPEEINEYIDLINISDKKIYKYLDIVKENIEGEEGKELEKKVRKLYTKWKPLRQKAIDLYIQGNIKESRQLVTGSNNDYVNNLENKMNDLHDYARNKATLFMENSNKLNKHLIDKILLASFIVFVTLIILGYILFSSIILEIKPLRDVMIKGAESKTLYIANIDGNSEITDMAKSYNKLAEKLNDHRENLEQKVKEQTQHLEKLIENLNIKEELLYIRNNELNKVLKQLRQSNEDLKQFAYIASHDLREPLRTINCYVQLLEKKYNAKLDAEADEYIDFITDGVNRMQTMIKDLLELSRAGTDLKEFEITNINDVIKQIEKSLALKIEEVQATIEVKDLPEINVDKRQICQLFQNLIANALKFHSDRPLKIVISAEEKDTEWIFSVKDNGIGIPQEYFKKIFEVFQRLHSRLEYEGTGIGLSICKKIIENHKGSIWVESEPGKGSTFFFTLPVSNNNEGAL